MRKICIINQKGGVAKTTTAVNLAAGLSMQEKKVLLLDLDPQGHVATYFPIEKFKKGMFEFFTNGAQLSECTHCIGKNFDAIISKGEMDNINLVLASRENSSDMLKSRLDLIDKYDYVIVDCPPSSGLLVRNIMSFADEAIIPTSLDPLGTDSLHKVISNIQEFNMQNGNSLKVSFIVPTMFDKRNKINKTVLNELTNEFYGMVTDPIRINTKLREAPRAKKSIFTYAPSSRGAKDYTKLVKTVINSENTVTVN
ncbi:MAG: Nitrogenase iron protein [Candidatus Woesearchaeota archaeon]|nr:Nitrogenase iron protein [Candidatus Woesearchaeota archaeon]